MAKSLDIQKNRPLPKRQKFEEAATTADTSTLPPANQDDASFYADEPDSVRRPGSALPIINVLLTLILLALIGTAGYLYLRGQNNGSSTPPLEEKTVRQELSNTTFNPTASQSQPASQPATSTPAISVKVLNGSGIEGAATTLASLLKAAGITVTVTGNAKSFNYQRTTIFYQSSKKAEAETVAALTKKNPVLEENNSSVTAGSEIVVVAGRE